MYDLIFYTTTQENSPVDDFLDSLGSKPRAKVERFMVHLKTHGPDLPRPYADILRGKIRELRVPYGRLHYRLLYFFRGRRIILTSGFLKKTPRIPEEEIERAERRMVDWINRNPEGGG